MAHGAVDSGRPDEVELEKLYIFNLLVFQLYQLTLKVPEVAAGPVVHI